MAKTKEGCLLGHGEKQKVTIRHFLPNKKLRKFPLFLEKTEHGNDSKDTWKIMSAAISRSGNNSI